MNYANRIIVYDEVKLRYIGRRAFTFLNLKRDDPIAYPDGMLNKGDFIVYADTRLPALSEEEASALERLGFDCHKKDGGIICAAVFDNPEVQPLVKRFDEKNAAELQRLDTYFDANRLSVTIDLQKENINVSFSGQNISAPLGSGTNAIFCFNTNGIKYFGYSSSERLSDLSALLSGEHYLGKSVIGNFDVDGLMVSDLFSMEFLKLMSLARKSGKLTLCHYNGVNFYMQATEFIMFGQKIIDFFISGKSDLLNHMDSATDLYQRLMEANSKYSNTSLATSFILRGHGPIVEKTRLLLQKACTTSVTILLTGESGTGKTYIAKEIHKSSKRSRGPFIHVNCAAIPYQLIESELFGYEEGSFTGARKGGKKGYFELAEGGTIFLDEITEMPLTLQGKLLEVLQNKTFYRVGGSEKISTNVRLIAATNRDLKRLVTEKEFREDLYYRINVFPIELPPLRSRKDAMVEIVNEVLPEICLNIDLEPLIVSGGAYEKLMAYSWPGNIRELENVLSKAAIMCNGEVIMPDDIEFPEGANIEQPVSGTLHEMKENYEKKLIADALFKFNGERGKTARYLGIGRTNLFEKIRKYGLEESAEEER